MKECSWTRFYLLLSLCVLYILIGKFYLDDFGKIIYEVSKQIRFVKQFFWKIKILLFQFMKENEGAYKDDRRVLTILTVSILNSNFPTYESDFWNWYLIKVLHWWPSWECFVCLRLSDGEFSHTDASSPSFRFPVF